MKPINFDDFINELEKLAKEHDKLYQRSEKGIVFFSDQPQSQHHGKNLVTIGEQVSEKEQVIIIRMFYSVSDLSVRKVEM